MKINRFIFFNIVLILNTILLINTTLAQEQLKHDIKYYQAEDGKLYWNKKLPVYIRIAPTPTDSGLLMKSEETKKYTNPYYLDTEGKNKVKSRWATNQKNGKTIIPQIEVSWEVYADGIAPVSKIDYINPIKYNNGNDVYYGGKMVFNINSKDATSGIENIYYSLNNEIYKPVNQEINITTEGKYSFKYYAVDKVGNVENVKKSNFYYDISPPKTFYTITGISENEVISLSTKIYLNAEDNLSGVAKTYYKIDDGKYNLYKNGTHIPLQTLKDGNHNLYIYSIDKVNNKEKEIIKHFYLDRTGPIIASDVLGDRYLIGNKTYFSGRTKMKLTAVDNKAGVENIYYSVDGGKFQKYNNPFYLPSLQGTHIVKYYATDKMKNDSEAIGSKYEKYKHVVSRIYVDLTGPILSHKIIGEKYKSRDTVFINDKTKIKLLGIDNEAGFQHLSYSINDQVDETKYSVPFTLKKQGFYNLTYYGYDNVNNRNRANISFYVDAEGPEIKYNFSIIAIGKKDKLDVYPNYAILYLAATDKTIGAKEIFYSINNSAYIKYVYSVKGFKKNTINTVKIKAKDILNNETNLELKFFVK